MGTRIHHLSNIILLGLLPVAFIGEPTFQFPVDCVLGTVIPLHAHIGMNSVISDYVPKVLRSTNPLTTFSHLILLAFCRVGILGLSVTAFIGLTQLNFSGPGITACVKALWRSPKAEETPK
jgi:succinate dehydrogenase (ubiquinone) membrane anchor subunit